MTSQFEQDIKRILIAVDPCHRDLIALERALGLAERMRAELIALFVEDENLLRLSALPFAREVQRSSAGERKLDKQQLTRQLQYHTTSLRESIQRSADRRNVRLATKVIQGEITRAALTALLETDVVFMEIFQPKQPYRPVSKIRADKESRLGLQSIIILFDGTAESMRALHLAAYLSQPEDVGLVVLLSTTSDQIELLQKQIQEVLREFRTDAFVHYLSEINVDHLRQVLYQHNCGMLVLHRDSTLLKKNPPVAIKNLGCPIVLVK